MRRDGVEWSSEGHATEERVVEEAARRRSLLGVWSEAGTEKVFHVLWCSLCEGINESKNKLAVLKTGGTILTLQQKQRRHCNQIDKYSAYKSYNYTVLTQPKKDQHSIQTEPLSIIINNSIRLTSSLCVELCVLARCLRGSGARPVLSTSATSSSTSSHLKGRSG